jgi:PAS domain S-box-containing protein
VADFFALCEAHPEAFVTGGRTVEAHSGPMLDPPLAARVEAFLVQLRAARDGDWGPIDSFLREVGERFMAAGLEVGAWHTITQSFYAAMVPHIVATFAGEPDRMSDVVVVLGAYVQRTAAIITREYLAAKDRALAASEESSLLWSHVLEQAQFGVIVTNLETFKVHLVNPGYAELLGYRPEQMIGMTAVELLADSSPEALAELGAIHARPGLRTYTFKLARADGTSFLARIASSTVTLRTGQRFSVATVVDDSERERMEATRAAAHDVLSRNARRLEQLARIGHELAGASGDLDAALALVARRLGETIGDACAIRLLSPDRRWIEPSGALYYRESFAAAQALGVLATQRQQVGTGLAGKVVATGEPIRLADTGVIAALADVPPAFQDAAVRIGITASLAVPLAARGKIIGVVNLLRGPDAPAFTADDQAFALELADRAGLAIDNAGLIATLEQRVAERTVELEAVNRELESFSYSVSHDLRAPLRAIGGFSMLLAEDHAAALPPEARDHLERIRHAAQRMSELIEDLLRLAKLARTSLERIRVDLSALAAEVLAGLQLAEPARRVEAHIQPALETVADARLVKILLENLLGNAWKFTAKQPSGEIWFGGSGGVYFVRDNGAGFDMKHASRLFAPFQRLHSAEDFEGSGVGLATTAKIVRHHGGRIWAESTPGAGATFYFTLAGRQAAP